MLIALTGGIAAGKSTVAEVWQALGAKHIDADLLAREVVSPGTPGFEQVVAEFGPSILSPDGSLNRTKLGEIIFNDQNARQKLENILHPLIQSRAKELVAEAGNLNVVYSIPLLVETKSPLKFNKIVTVSAPEAVRQKRLVANRGLSNEEALKRIQSQATDSQREAVADLIINSDCSLEELKIRAATAWRELTGMG